MAKRKRGRKDDPARAKPQDCDHKTTRCSGCQAGYVQKSDVSAWKDDPRVRTNITFGEAMRLAFKRAAPDHRYLTMPDYTERQADAPLPYECVWNPSTLAKKR